MSGVIYIGVREYGVCDLVELDGCDARVVSAEMRPAMDRRGIALQWGDRSDGSLALARSLLVLATGDTALAMALGDEYLRQVVSQLRRNGWEMRRDAITLWVARHKHRLCDIDGDPFPLFPSFRP